MPAWGPLPWLPASAVGLEQIPWRRRNTAVAPVPSARANTLSRAAAGCSFPCLRPRARGQHSRLKSACEGTCTSPRQVPAKAQLVLRESLTATPAERNPIRPFLVRAQRRFDARPDQVSPARTWPFCKKKRCAGRSFCRTWADLHDHLGNTHPPLITPPSLAPKTLAHAHAFSHTHTPHPQYTHSLSASHLLAPAYSSSAIIS